MPADTSFSPSYDLTETALELLRKDGCVSDVDIEQARKLTGATGASILLTLNQIGVVSDDRLARTFASITGLAVFENTSSVENSGISTALNPEFQRENKCYLIDDSGPLLVVDPLDERLMRAVEFALGCLPSRQIIRFGDWQCLYQVACPTSTHNLNDLDQEEDEFASELADQARNAPLVRQVNAWLNEAADRGASDIHFDTKRNAFEVLYRQDGDLRSVSTQPKPIAAGVMTRIKVIAGLDLGERSKPQDGRATIVVRGRRLDIRVSIIPTIDGESAVIRLLDRQTELLSIEGLGFESPIKAELRRIIEQRHGMFVVAGPTGSGKTTTLYACIQELAGRGLKILSVEDPVEYHFDHVSQVQISEKAGRTFASALRAFMRHDPDVILVGEIRDPETAMIAVQAALSGHLVFATLHAIDSFRVETRLVDMGVEAFKLDSCLLGAMSQRLVRRLCPDCRKPIPAPEALHQKLAKCGATAPFEVWHSSGCEACDWTGHQGRVALADLNLPASANDVQSLEVAALAALMNGETDLAEVGALIT